MLNRFRQWSCIAVFLLVFFSIAFYGAADDWFEAAVCGLLFAFCAGAVWQGVFLRHAFEYRRLLRPVLLLAFFSILQAFSALFFPPETLADSFYLPESFDLTASFQNGIKILALISFFCLFTAALRRNFELTIWSLLAAGNFFAAFAVIKFLLYRYFPEFAHNSDFLPIDPETGFGTFNNRNHFALSMLLTFGLNAGLLWFGKRPKLVRLCLFALCLICFSATILSASRGGIISLFAVNGVLILFAAARSERSLAGKGRLKNLPTCGKPFALFALISLVFIAGIVLIGRHRVLHRFAQLPAEIEKNDKTQSYRRVDAWKACGKMIRENWLFGVGFGGFRYAVSQYINISGQNAPQQAHNDYLEFIASGGLIAVVLAGWFLYGFIRLVRKRLKPPGDFFVTAARIGALGGIGGAALHSLFDFGLQFTGNLLFFAALGAVAVHKTAVFETGETGFPAEKTFRLKFAASFFLLVLAGTSVLFADARFDFRRFRNQPNAVSTESGRFHFSFDADFCEASADIYLKNGDWAAARRELEKAVAYRPKDYRLRLKLAQVTENQNEFDAAENSYRQAVKIAPFYGEPHFLFGNFLIKNRQKEEALREFSAAFHSDNQYSEAIIEDVWKATDGDAAQILETLSPLNDSQKEKLARFLFAREAYSGLVFLNAAGEFPANVQNMLVRRLIDEKKQFQFAWQIFKKQSLARESETVDLIDGDFENGEPGRGSGFGWRVGDSFAPENFKFDDKTAASGNRSLRFSFNGAQKNSVISQIVPIQKNARYRLEFSYKADEIISGGLALQAISRRPDFEIELGEVELKAEKNGWAKRQIEFQTGEQTEAVEIKIVVQSCGRQPCPAHGNFWIDDFRLKKKESGRNETFAR